MSSTVEHDSVVTDFSLRVTLYQSFRSSLPSIPTSSLEDPLSRIIYCLSADLITVIRRTPKRTMLSLSHPIAKVLLLLLDLQATEATLCGSFGFRYTSRRWSSIEMGTDLYYWERVLIIDNRVRDTLDNTKAHRTVRVSHSRAKMREKRFR